MDEMRGHNRGEMARGKDEAARIVMFHVSWCHHCKRTLPLFLEAALLMAFAKRRGGADPIRFYHLDATDDKEVTKRFPSRGYPKILFWPLGAETYGYF